ncbi:DeoR family transcriptional regulator [bacterium]|nr:DeoR family transcriptional regulator [bacterium]
MLQHKRHAQILSYLAENEFLSVDEAVQLLNASPATIRRDFNMLSEENLALRMRGGLRRSNNSILSIKPFDVREVSHAKEKAALARRVVSFLNSGDVFFVDGGTTTFQLASCLPNIPLRMVTNSLRLAMELGEKRMSDSSLQIFLTGGYLYPQSGQLTGPLSKASLNQYHAKWAFISPSMVDENRLYYSNEMVMETARTMIENADNVVVLADHSKIGNRAMCHLCEWEKVNTLITDTHSETQPTLQLIQEQGVEI